MTLWIVHTHSIAAADTTPYLDISSPERRSRKSTLLEVLELLAAQPWRVIRPSEAVLFRKINLSSLFLDEVDTVFRDKTAAYEGLRAILNAGHRREVMVPRCVGEGKKIDIVEFEVFGVKAFAGIGTLPDTVADRSIPIRLARKARYERVDRFRYRTAAKTAAQIRKDLGDWAPPP